jgi:hypothetical protein
MTEEKQTAFPVLGGERVRDGGSEVRLPIGEAASLPSRRRGKAMCAEPSPACTVARGERGQRMRYVVGFVLVCLSFALPQTASAGGLAIGMSEREVVALLGPPDAVRLERNGVVCLTYEQQQHRVFSRLFGERTQVIALKDNHLVDDDTVRTRDIRFHCSHVAGRWDPPMREPLISCTLHCR